MLASMQFGDLSKNAALEGRGENGREVIAARGGAGNGLSVASERPVSIPSKRITFGNLFAKAREEFLASDPNSLRTFLNELQTHDLLDRRKGADAAEQLWIPLSKEQVATVLSTISH